jgi:CheY-like chemotaxis protein
MPNDQGLAIVARTMTLRLLIVDDNAHFLAAARSLLTSEAIEVVAVASTIADALVATRELRPDVSLIDVDLGDENGLDLTEMLTEAGRGEVTPVILTSAYPAQDLADLIETSPAVGFLPKSQLSAQAILDLLHPIGDAHTD